MAEEKKDFRVGRRSFLTRLGFGAAAVAATTVVGPPPKPDTGEQASLRPKCKSCSTRMVIRDSAAHCPNTECRAYWKPVSIILQDEVEEKRWAARKLEEFKLKYRKFRDDAKKTTTA